MNDTNRFKFKQMGKLSSVRFQSFHFSIPFYFSFHLSHITCFSFPPISVICTPGGGGGGALPYICILGMCQRETPIFSPKFPLQSISFSQMTNIFRSGASPFYIFAIPETIIFKFSSRTSRLLPPTAGLL